MVWRGVEGVLEVNKETVFSVELSISGSLVAVVLLDLLESFY